MTSPRDPADRNDAKTSWWRRVPWWLWVAFVVILVIAFALALGARGQAVDDVSSGQVAATLASALLI